MADNYSKRETRRVIKEARDRFDALPDNHKLAVMLWLEASALEMRLDTPTVDGALEYVRVQAAIDYAEQAAAGIQVVLTEKHRLAKEEEEAKKRQEVEDME